MTGPFVTAPRPGVEPGTSRSKRGMMSVSPPGRAASQEADLFQTFAEQQLREHLVALLRQSQLVTAVSLPAGDLPVPSGAGDQKGYAQDHLAAADHLGAGGRLLLVPAAHGAFLTVDLPRIELGSPACRAGVVPLDHRPGCSGPLGNRTPISGVRYRRRPV